jgi:hypothetical protein
MATVSLVSDLHLELAAPPELKGGDILLMAGDIWTAAGIERRGALRRRFQAFCKRELSKYRLVLLVHGNHEFYGSTIEAAPGIIEEFLAEHAPHAVILDNGVQLLGNVCFVGSTLWAPHGAGDPGAELVMVAHVEDFREITFRDGTRFMPNAANALHRKASAFLTSELQRQKRAGRTCIVLTHHAPSYRSKGDAHYAIDLDDAFYSDQEALIEANPHIALWCHGHSHRSCRYVIGATTVISNQRGYVGLEPMADAFDPNAVDFELNYHGRR